MFLENCWYVAAWDHELIDGNLLPRTLLGERHGDCRNIGHMHIPGTAPPADRKGAGDEDHGAGGGVRTEGGRGVQQGVIGLCGFRAQGRDDRLFSAGRRFTSTIPTATPQSASTSCKVSGSCSSRTPSASANTGVRKVKDDICVAG